MAEMHAFFRTGDRQEAIAQFALDQAGRGQGKAEAGGAGLPGSVIGIEAVGDAQPPVSPSRRSAGMFIAMMLLVALIVSAAWLILRTAKNVTPATDTARAKVTTKK